MKNQSVSVSFMLLAILFNVCLIVANLIGIKVIQIGSASVSAALLVFPISYIINDCISEIWGFRKARLVILSGFAMNLFVVALGMLAIAIPAAPFWDGSEHFNYVFGMAPRTTIGSLLAFIVGSLLNAYVMSRMKKANHGKYFSLRAITSTVVGEGADSLIFFPIAFGGIIPWKEVMMMVVTQIVLKSLYEVVVLPFTLLFVKRLRAREENELSSVK